MNAIDVLSIAKFKKSQSVFDALDIPYAVIKGEVLSIQAYGITGKRTYTDIDILISRSNINDIEKILLKDGFVSTLKNRADKIIMLTSSHQVAPWVKDISPFGNIEIDLNFDLFWGEYRNKHIDISTFINDTIELDIYGVKVKTLKPIKAIIQLILHHYKDMNSIFILATRKSIRYNMFEEVYNLLMNNIESISIDSLYNYCMEYQILPYVYYIFYYTGQIFKNKRLENYINAFWTLEGEKLLDCYGLDEQERKMWKFSFDDRLKAPDLYQLIKNDLTANDHNKIKINDEVFKK